MKSIQDVMSESIFVAAPGDSLLSATRKMVERNISCLLVMDADKMVGIVSGRDILRAMVTTGDVSSHTVGEVMTSPVISFPVSGFILDLFTMMETRKVKQIPILDEQGSVVGIVTQTDLVRGISHMLEVK